MKQVLTLLTVSTFIAIAVFGFLAMSPKTGSHEGCIAAIAGGLICPETSNALDSLSFHTKAFQSFSRAVVNDFSSFVFQALAFLLSILFLTLFGREFRLKLHRRPFFSRELLTVFSSPVSLLLIRWRALHENSPAFS